MAGFELSVELPGGEVVQLDVEPSYTVDMVKQKLQNHVISSVEEAKHIRILIHSKDMTQEFVSFNRVAEVRRTVADTLGCQPAFVGLTALTYDSDDPSAATRAECRLQDDQPCTAPGSFSEECIAFAQSHDLTERASELLKRLPLDAQRTTCSCTDWASDASEFIDQLATMKGITLQSPILGADVVMEVDRSLGKPAEPRVCSCLECEAMNLKLLSKMVRGSGSRRRIDAASDSDEEPGKASVQHAFTALPESHLEVRFWRNKQPEGYIDKGTNWVYDWEAYGKTWRLVRRSVAMPTGCQIISLGGKQLSDTSTLRACGVDANSTLLLTPKPRLMDPERRTVVGSAMLAWLSNG